MIPSSIYQTAALPDPCQPFSRKLARLAARMLRPIILKFADPECVMMVHGSRLQMPFSHPLPMFLSQLPQYDSVLERIARHLRPPAGGIGYVDIGANIGDTIAAIRPQENDSILAVEPFTKYRAFLEKNRDVLGDGITIIDKACVEHPDVGCVNIQGSNGTAVLKQDPAGGIPTTTLNALFHAYPQLSKCDLLKIDVDGHDFEVIRGGLEFIESRKPVIIMESDVFDNASYVDDVIALCKKLEAIGYKHLIAYDHQGGMIHATSLSRAESLASVLFYQTSRRNLFLDLLFGTDLDAFFKEELRFYATEACAAGRSPAALRAAEMWQSTMPLNR